MLDPTRSPYDGSWRRDKPLKYVRFLEELGKASLKAEPMTGRPFNPGRRLHALPRNIDFLFSLSPGNRNDC